MSDQSDNTTWVYPYLDLNADPSDTENEVEKPIPSTIYIYFSIPLLMFSLEEKPMLVIPSIPSDSITMKVTTTTTTQELLFSKSSKKKEDEGEEQPLTILKKRKVIQDVDIEYDSDNGKFTPSILWKNHIRDEFIARKKFFDMKTLWKQLVEIGMIPKKKKHIDLLPHLNKENSIERYRRRVRNSIYDFCCKEAGNYFLDRPHSPNKKRKVNLPLKKEEQTTDDKTKDRFVIKNNKVIISRDQLLIDPDKKMLNKLKKASYSVRATGNSLSSARSILEDCQRKEIKWWNTPAVQSELEGDDMSKFIVSDDDDE